MRATCCALRVAPVLTERQVSCSTSTPVRQQSWARAATSLALCVALAVPSPDACAAWADAAQQERNDSALTGGARTFRPLSREEAQRKRALFTDESYTALLALARYAEYVEALRTSEAAPGCEACAANRLRLERAWQTVANEINEGGSFRQATWGAALQRTLARAGGVLRDSRATQAALTDLVSQVGDPYSVYLPPAAFRAALRRPLPAERDYAAALSTGIGLQLGGRQSNSGWRIAEVAASSPAEEAGVHRGDYLVAVDAVDMRSTSVSSDDVAALLRGPEGSAVTLTLARPGGRGPLHSVRLERRALQQPAVTVRALPLPRGGLAAYVRIRYFSSDGTAALRLALLEGEVDGVDGYVFDLRNDPGGVLEEAVASAAMLLPCGAVVARTQRGGVDDISYRACELPAGQFASPPMAQLSAAQAVVLLDGGSASAAEVFAGALRDNGRARLLGERSFGKSSVQFFFPQADGGLKLTVKKWLTPKRRDVGAQPRGLLPDDVCVDYPRALGATQDACLRAALRMLNADRSRMT